MSYDQQAFAFQRGRHYVVYPDGSRTMLMPKRHAEGYASIFGGALHSVDRSDLETEDDAEPSLWARVKAWLWGT